MKPMLELKNLSVGFKDVLYSNINASLPVGSFACLLGVNGIGKSCLLKTIARLQSEKQGKIFLEDKDIASFSLADLSRKIGIVLTEKLQIEYLTVFELVSFGRAPYTGSHGALSEKDKAVIDKVLAQTGISELSGLFFSELSDGQKQKALIARALAQQPELLILDEPTTYLDIPSKIDLIRLLRKLTQENNISVLLSTHDLDLIKPHVDKFWLMGKDGVFSEGSPEDLISSGLIKENFFKSGSM